MSDTDREAMLTENPTDVTTEGVYIHGPLGNNDNHELVVDGVSVPYIKLMKVEGEEDGWVMNLDNRFGSIVLTRREITQNAWFWANAMAISAGFTCHGGSSRINPHGPPVQLN